MASVIDPIARPGAGLAAAPQSGEPAAPPTNVAGSASAKGQVAFADVLQRVSTAGANGIQFSAHAQRRLQSRAIPFGQEELHRLQKAVDKAERKGARDSLILIDELALVVNIKNRVVITAIDKESRQENIFTNIDSVVMT